MRVLSWNLFHGRAVPPAGRDLLEQFVAALAGWSWDAALLQEVPPWWPPVLATRLRGEQRMVLTSRNALLPLRRTAAIRWPDLMKSAGGGANAIIVRGASIVEHRRLRLALLPERRWLHAVHLVGGELGELWLANLHASAGAPAPARRQAVRAQEALWTWSAGLPAVLGGDFNLRQLSLEGFVPAAARDVDHIFTRGLEPTAATDALDRGALSDHPPLLAELIAPSR